MSAPDRQPKFIFITGGVVSSLGKGVASASLGLLLRAAGLRVSFLKFDPYLNRDAGSMDAHEHGEIFITADGARADLDLGHYERFADVTLGGMNDVTTGQIYGDVLERERAGAYEGETVQVIPHITNAIRDAILRAADAAPVDVLLVELGGTIGDIEGMPYIEAIRQFMLARPKADSLLVHLVLLPAQLAGGADLKTKPAQHSAQKLRECGLHMDFLLCRMEGAMTKEARAKLALHTNTRPERVIAVPDVKLIYNVPARLHEQGLDAMVCERLGLPHGEVDLSPWERYSAAVLSSGTSVKIAAVGDCAGMADCYKSLGEALQHATAARGVRLELDWIDAEALEGMGGADAAARLSGCAGLVVPGGEGFRGAFGRLEAIRRAREGKIPFLGICYGMQCAVVEFARNVCGFPNAISAEWIAPGSPFTSESWPEDCWITRVDGRAAPVPAGGEERFGTRACRVLPGTLARAAYGAERVEERQSHRYTVNPEKLKLLESHGLVVSARRAENDLAEMIELPAGEQWFVATQAHPEFTSRPLRPHPLFVSFIDAVLAREAKQ